MNSGPNPSPTEVGSPDAAAKLQDVLELPLGTVLSDRKGRVFIFVGTRANSASLEFHFHPDASQQPRDLAVEPPIYPCNYSLVEGAFKRFPGLVEYATKQCETQVDESRRVRT